MAPANLRKEGSAFDLTYPSKFLSFLKTRKAKVPIIHRPRIYGASKYGLERTFKVLKDLSIIIFNHKLSQSKRVRT